MNVCLPKTKWPRKQKKNWTNVVCNKVTKRNPMPKGGGINLPLLLVIICKRSKNNIAINTCLPQTKWQRFFKKPTGRFVSPPLPSSFVNNQIFFTMSTFLPQNDQKKKNKKTQRKGAWALLFFHRMQRIKKQQPYEHLFATNKLIQQPKKPRQGDMNLPPLLTIIYKG